MTDLVPEKRSLLDQVIRFFLEQKIIVFLIIAMIIGWGVMVAPFDWNIGGLERDPVPVDAIPDIGENQQIVFTKWPGRSPQDIDDQITYPMTVALLGIPGVKSIRSYSMFGFSSIYVIFKDNVEFYWSRTRVLEKLNSLPPDTLPDGVSPMLGPDATALGQIYEYTLEGRDPDGNPSGGWGPEELRSIQDWTVRYALMSADGVSEVASIGGYVKEYQIDVDPDAMRSYGVTLNQVFKAVHDSNVDVGARTISVNRAEYVIRGLGFIKHVKDIENIAVAARAGIPVLVKDIAHVSKGPALRRGALDKSGAEAVGGVVVARYGDNPLRVIKNVKEKIAQISLGLPEKILPDGTKSKVTIVPFYDRTGLIYETLGTLNSALADEVLVTVIIVIVMVLHLRSTLLISGLLPLAALMTFIAMKIGGVDANVVALTGIAIEIGALVDVGIVFCENILRHLEESEKSDKKEKSIDIIYRASTEVGSAVMTAVATTVVSFLPVFTMTGAEGKLFKPLAYTKTFALVSAVIIAITLLPALAHLLFTIRIRRNQMRRVFGTVCALVGGLLWLKWGFAAGGLAAFIFGSYWIMEPSLPNGVKKICLRLVDLAAIILVLSVLVEHWEPLGAEYGFIRNFAFAGTLIAALLLFFYIFLIFYPLLLAWALRNKLVSLVPYVVIVAIGLTVWLGFDKTSKWLPQSWQSSEMASYLSEKFPGMGKEFMPSLDEGSFLYMPTTMPHASIGEALDSIAKLDMAIQAVPEVDEVVGKIGRIDSPLDPAPISMVESIINYKPEYILNKEGHRVNFKFDEKTDEFARDEHGNLIPDDNGHPYRQWRDSIKSPNDIWAEIAKVAQMPGMTGAPKLQPIETRIVMLQSGFRAPMGIKVYGPDLPTIDEFGLELERLLKQVPEVEPAAVFADRIVGKPYLEININREKIARYGISIRNVQDVIEVAIGGKKLTTTVEGRERYPVRVRYARELRDSIESLDQILVPTKDGKQIPMIELAEIKYIRGPQVIKSEDTFLTGYVLLDKKPQYAEVDVVEAAQRYLNSKIESGELVVPAGVSYHFAGSYENQIRASKRLAIVLPLALVIIFVILYFQFRSLITTSIVFNGVFLAWSGGFILLWLYGQPWFMDFSIFERDIRDLFQMHTINLSVAVWVGFLALFGIATDNGVLQATLLDQVFARNKPKTIADIRTSTVEAGQLRSRACLMTTAATILALLPVLTSTGRGSDIMVPMAIPSFGGMLVALLSLFVVPILYCAMKEWKLRFSTWFGKEGEEDNAED